MAHSLAVVLVVAAVAAAPAAGTHAQTPPRGGTVVFGPISEPGCLNPLLLACPSPQSFFWVLEKVLVPPFALGPDFAAQPRLVSRVAFTSKPPFTVTYEIRREARWSDGTPVTARDFVFTHRAIRRHLAGKLEAGIHGLVRSIRAVDAKTVRVVLRSRDARWRERLFFFVLPQHALVGENLERIWTDGIINPKTGKPIGSGPFLVQRWERGKQLTLVRNPRYWGPHVSYLDRLVIRFCRACTAPPPAEVLSALRQGEVDFALSRDTGIVPDLRQIPGTRVVATPSNGWEHLALRLGPGGHRALRSKLVRRALAYGIDRVAIVRQLFGGIDPRSRPSDSAVFLNTDRHYRPTWSRYRYRPAEARRLLEQAGCRRGVDGIYVCAGEKLSLRFLTIAGGRLRERGLELMQSQLRAIGVEVVLAFVAGPAFIQTLEGGDFDGFSFTFFIPESDLGEKEVFGCGGSQNFTGYCQRLVTSDLDQAQRILDAEQRARVITRVDRQLARDVPVIPLYQVPFVLAFRKAVQNVVPAPNNLFWNAEDWWVER